MSFLSNLKSITTESDIQDIDAAIEILEKNNLMTKLYRLNLPFSWNLTREQHIDKLKKLKKELEAKNE
jgi:hypothetical protein